MDENPEGQKTSQSAAAGELSVSSSSSSSSSSSFSSGAPAIPRSQAAVAVIAGCGPANSAREDTREAADGVVERRRTGRPCFDFHALGSCEKGGNCDLSHEDLSSNEAVQQFVSQHKDELKKLVSKQFARVEHQWWLPLFRAFEAGRMARIPAKLTYALRTNVQKEPSRRDTAAGAPSSKRGREIEGGEQEDRQGATAVIEEKMVDGERSDRDSETVYWPSRKSRKNRQPEAT